MTENDVITLGEYCENLLSQEHFATLVKQYETQTIEHLLSTAPEEKERREDLYASMTGVRDFLGLMKFFVTKKEQLIEEQNEQALSEDTDALPTQDI